MKPANACSYLMVAMAIFILMFIGCNQKSTGSAPAILPPSVSSSSQPDDIEPTTMTINDEVFNVILYETAAATELTKLLPFTIEMKDLNQNEKYYYFDNSFTTEEKILSTVKAGDIMLYQGNCLVIFYKTFDTSYSYTPIGYIENVAKLAQAMKGDSALLQMN